MIRKVKLLSNLILIQSLIILLPNWLFGSISAPKAWFAVFFYIALFFSSVRRQLIYGELSERKSDRQIQTKTAIFSYVFLFGGILLSLWLSIYDYNSPLFRTINFSIFFESAGFLLMLLAVGLNIHASGLLGRFYDRLAISENHELIKEGVYKYVRHPIYTSYFFLFLGTCLFYSSLLGSALLIFCFFLGYMNRIKLEESMLTERFGNEYKDYMEQTWRFIPFIY